MSRWVFRLVGGLCICASAPSCVISDEVAYREDSAPELGPTRQCIDASGQPLEHALYVRCRLPGMAFGSAAFVGPMLTEALSRPTEQLPTYQVIAEYTPPSHRRGERSQYVTLRIVAQARSATPTQREALCDEFANGGNELVVRILREAFEDLRFAVRDTPRRAAFERWTVRSDDRIRLTDPTNVALDDVDGATTLCKKEHRLRLGRELVESDCEGESASTPLSTDDLQFLSEELTRAFNERAAGLLGTSVLRMEVLSAQRPSEPFVELSLRASARAESLERVPLRDEESLAGNHNAARIRREREQRALHRSQFANLQRRLACSHYGSEETVSRLQTALSSALTAIGSNWPTTGAYACGVHTTPPSTALETGLAVDVNARCPETASYRLACPGAALDAQRAVSISVDLTRALHRTLLRSKSVPHPYYFVEPGQPRVAARTYLDAFLKKTPSLSVDLVVRGYARGEAESLRSRSCGAFAFADIDRVLGDEVSAVVQREIALSGCTLQFTNGNGAH